MSTEEIEEFELDGENVEIVRDFVFLGAKIEDSGSCKGKLLRRLALGRAAMTGLNNIWKDKDKTITTKCRIVNALVFLVVLYGCESWTIRKAERRRIDIFELWCWRRLLRIPWTARRTNKSVIEEIKATNPQEALIKKCMFIHGRPSGSNGTTDIYNQTTCKRMLHKIVSLLENSQHSQHSQHSRPWRFVDQCLPASQITCRLGVPSAPVSGQHEQAYSPRVPAYAERTTFQCADKAVNRSNSLARSVIFQETVYNVSRKSCFAKFRRFVVNIHVSL